MAMGMKRLMARVAVSPGSEPNKAPYRAPSIMARKDSRLKKLITAP
jgi:hypothetical protein